MLEAVVMVATFLYVTLSVFLLGDVVLAWARGRRRLGP